MITGPAFLTNAQKLLFGAGKVCAKKLLACWKSVLKSYKRANKVCEEWKNVS